MNIALWIAQVLLAVVFLYSGIAKASLPKDRLIAIGQTGVAPFPLPFIRTIATLELLGCVGLILPQATGIAPYLTVAAAAGLGIIMIGAAFAHRSLGEYKQVFGVNLPLFLICVFVVVGRLLGY
ncbi:DoxX family protein [Leifsonia poae]|uniref:DoxX family protein n=1 Tax=Leifsonia poae TaxID=110933 RepID=UPI001CBD9A2E|nr:DoxX family protein [Leifsonia poae]